MFLIWNTARKWNKYVKYSLICNNPFKYNATHLYLRRNLLKFTELLGLFWMCQLNKEIWSSPIFVLSNIKWVVFRWISAVSLSQWCVCCHCKARYICNVQGSYFVKYKLLFYITYYKVLTKHWYDLLLIT